MNLFNLSTSPGWEIVGWTMCYFLVAGTAVALVGALLRRMLKRSAPQVRYVVSLAVLTILALLPLGIVFLLSHREAIELPKRLVLNAEQSVPNAEFSSPPASPPRNQSDGRLILPTDPAIPLRAPNPVVTPRPMPSQEAAIPDQGLWPQEWLGFITYLPWVWLIGTPLTVVLLATGLIGSTRLRQQSTPVTDGPIHATSERVRAALACSRNIKIAIHERITSPQLVGVLRPMILLPPAALTGWSPEQLEMVLLHELAHVRRWDNLVNFVQRVVESLLFFHPCVWWVSRWVRSDREECCDAIVVAHTAKPQAYAELLVTMASPTTPLAGLALSQHPLTYRIRRILKIEDEKMLVTRSTVGWACLALASMLTVATWQPTKTTIAEEPKSTVAPGSAEGSTTNTEEKKEKATTDTNNTKEKASPVVPDAVPGQTNSPFLSLEDQRAADLAYKLLGLELAPLNEEEFQRVKAKNFEGGLRLVATNREFFGGRFASPGDLLVGLHVWPIASLQDVAKLLQRDDLNDLDPLKFYAIRRKQDDSYGGSVGDAKPEEELVTGRLPVNTDAIKESSTGDEYKRTTSYNLSSGDSVKVIATGVYPDQPIDDVYRIEPTGAIALGPIYGRIKIAGLTPIEAEQKVQKLLETILTDVRVQITLYQKAVNKNQRNRNTYNVPQLIDSHTRNDVIAGISLPLPNRPQLLPPREEIQPQWPHSPEHSNREESSGSIIPARPNAYLDTVDSEQPRASFDSAPASETEMILRYGGMTFDRWKTIWHYELSINERTETVRAMAAFGNAGHGKEAAKVILEVAGQYDWKNMGDNNSLLSLQQACCSAFGLNQGNPVPNALPADLAAAALLKSLDSKNVRTRAFLTWVMPNFLHKNPAMTAAFEKLKADKELEKYLGYKVVEPRDKPEPTSGFDGYEGDVNQGVGEAPFQR